MRRLHGTGTDTGIGDGPARLLLPRLNVEERFIEEKDVAAEVDRFDAAIADTDAGMARIAERAPKESELGREMADVHRAILGSTEFSDDARTLIRSQRVGAEWAVRQVVEALQQAFSELTDERLRGGFAEVQAVADRLLGVLFGAPVLALDERFSGKVALGTELSPLDVLELHRLGAAGLATEHGGPTSHTSIVARAVGLPYVFAVHGLLASIRPEEPVWVDGTRGVVVTSPDGETLRGLEASRAAEIERQRSVGAQRREPAITVDGTLVSLGANVESSAEAADALDAGADHIGLVRTELLYLGRREPPNEDEQYADALAILAAARGAAVTFRTLDVSGDQPVAGIRLGVSPNPALGLRGIRLSLRQPGLFRTQLRALYRAASVGPVRILLPLVSNVEEVRDAREECTRVCRDLAATGHAHDAAAPLGAMIETPSAALTADHIAGACDFLSVGTNDLIQYAFAADRDNEEVSSLYQPGHPAVLRALELVFSAADRARRPVSVCGDMAADPKLTRILVGLGLRSFSMPARSLPFVKAIVRGTALPEAVALARHAMTLTTHAEVMALVTG